MLQKTSDEASLLPVARIMAQQGRMGERMCLAINQAELSGWGREQLARVVTKVVSSLSGKLNPAVMPLLLLSGEIGEQVAAVCAFFHAAADLADDAEDQELPLDWQPDGIAQAFNSSQGLLFLQQRQLLALPLPVEIRLELMKLFAEAGWWMHDGQRWDLLQTNQQGPIPYRRVAELKAGAEIGAFVAASALVADWPVEPARAFGQALGSMLQIYSDHADIWLTEVSDDLVAGKWTAPLQACPDQDRLLQLMAGDRRQPDFQRAIRQALLTGPVPERLRDDLACYRRQWNTALEQLPALSPLEPICRWLEEEVETLAMGLEEMVGLLQGLPAIPPRCPWRQAEEMAKLFLQSDPSHGESWEIHRWGFLGKSELVGDVFQTALLADVMAETGLETGPLVQRLVEARSQDGWHYYAHEQAIPPDSDDLGQILQVFARLALAREVTEPLFRGPIDQLLAHVEADGSLHTWLTGGESGEIVWMGDRCPSVMANAYYGLLAYDQARHARLFDQAVRHFLSLRSWRGFHYASRGYETLVVIRFLKKWAPLTQDQDLRRAIADRCDQVGQSLKAQQRLDGGWGSPQETALTLGAGLVLGSVSSEAVKRALIYLSDAQASDGGWPAEPLYRCPGKGNQETWHVSRLLTSALCLRGLFQGRQQLELRRGTRPL